VRARAQAPSRTCAACKSVVGKSFSRRVYLTCSGISLNLPIGPTHPHSATTFTSHILSHVPAMELKLSCVDNNNSSGSIGVNLISPFMPVPHPPAHYAYTTALRLPHHLPGPRDDKLRHSTGAAVRYALLVFTSQPILPCFALLHQVSLSDTTGGATKLVHDSWQHYAYTLK
jgi:hypothetical protein